MSKDKTKPRKPSKPKTPSPAQQTVIILGQLRISLNNIEASLRELVEQGGGSEETGTPEPEV